jgi:hypothetical protein
VWPVSRGCLLLLGTWSYLRICRRSVLPYTRFCNCLLDYGYVLHIVNFTILYVQLINWLGDSWWQMLTILELKVSANWLCSLIKWYRCSSGDTVATENCDAGWTGQCADSYQMTIPCSQNVIQPTGVRLPDCWKFKKNLKSDSHKNASFENPMKTMPTNFSSLHTVWKTRPPRVLYQYKGRKPFELPRAGSR